MPDVVEGEAGTRPLVEVFSAERPRLVGLAYRMTGRRTDAEDLVQEAWLRASQADWAQVDRPEAWLTTVVSRLALDALKSARYQREAYVGPWLAEPVLTSEPKGTVEHDPAELTALAESLTLGFLRILEELSPVERVVLILADVFGTPYQDIAEVVDRSPAACRQVASRARQHMRGAGPGTGRSQDPPAAATRVAHDLAEALAEGEVERVLTLLAEDAVMVSDGGPDHHAARRPVIGAYRVGRLLLNLTSRLGANYEADITSVNGEPGSVIRIHGELFAAVTLRVDGGVVREVHLMVNPDKLASLNLTAPIV